MAPPRRREDATKGVYTRDNAGRTRSGVARIMLSTSAQTLATLGSDSVDAVDSEASHEGITAPHGSPAVTACLRFNRPSAAACWLAENCSGALAKRYGANSGLGEE